MLVIIPIFQTVKSWWSVIKALTSLPPMLPYGGSIEECPDPNIQVHAVIVLIAKALIKEL